MSIPIEGVRYYYDHVQAAWVAPGRPSLPTMTNEDALFRPVSLGNDASEALVREALGVPADANLVWWTWGNTDLETVFANYLSDNDILVLPERANPYLIDSSKGFMASGVASIDGVGADGLKNGIPYPIISNPRLWFEMTRARRGIIGLGPGVVIEPSQSSWTQGPGPVLENQRAGDQFQNRYMTNGTVGTMLGSPNHLIGFDHARPFFANFTLRGRSFGGVFYSGITPSGGVTQHFTLKRVFLDGAWRSHPGKGVPNGETGGIALNGGTYLIENVDLNVVDGSSPIMWNNNTGGIVRNARSNWLGVGMWTFWRCGGKNVFENVHIVGRISGMNLEELRAGFELEWNGGSLSMTAPTNKFHFGINPAPPAGTGIAGGPPRITMRGVTCATNAYTPGAMTANIYTTYGVAKRSWISCDTLPVSCVPAVGWVA